ncbi:MAG: hypothetical protein ACOY33_04575 [Pseudomonadota bacterium]
MRHLLPILLLLLPALAPGGEKPVPAAPAQPAAADVSVNVAMTDIGALMARLLSDNVLADPDAAIRQLNELDERFRKLEPHTVDRGPAFRISWQTMVEQIGRSRDAVDSGIATPDMLRNLVHGIASACAGCHTQDDRSRALSFGQLEVPATYDTLQKARFKYITRDYDGALKLYDEYLDSRRRLAWDGPVLDAFEGELTILAQVYRKPERGVKALKRRLERSSGVMSKQVREDVRQWIEGFENIRRANLKAGSPSYADLEAYAKQYILPHAGEVAPRNEQDKVISLWLRGLLHEYVQSHPADPHMADLLYWLASVDRALDYNFYYSLADLYLKECILRYPATDTAESCYDEYDRYVRFAYSGSGGEHIPVEIRDELLRLRETLDAAHKAREVPALLPPAP